MPRTKELDAVVAKLRKEHGDDILLWGSEIQRELIPRCTTGALSLDVALGGGWPMNQWVEIIGEESSGKSAAIAKTLAANMKRDPNWVAFYADAEGTADGPWMEAMGVDMDRLIIMNDNGMEKVYQAAIAMLDSRQVDCVVIDSQPQLVPESEDLAQIEELQVGLGARITNKFFRKQRSAIRRSLIEQERPVLGILVNQWREKIGVMYGDNRTTPGGRGKNFACAVRLEVRRDDWIEVKGVRVGQAIKFNAIKNKTAPPRRTAVVDFYFDDVVSDEGEILHRKGSYDVAKDMVNTAVIKGAIRQTGGGMFYFEEEKWKGRPALYEAVGEDSSLLGRIEAAVLGGPGDLAKKGAIEVVATEVTKAKKVQRRVVKK